jgi:hypothetical protein
MNGRSLVCVLAALAFLASAGSQARADAARDARILLGLGLSTYYDDNLLQYSSDQVALLDSGTRPERFSVESADAPVVSPSISLSRIDRLGPGRARTLRLRGQGEFHGTDGTADFRSIGALWQEPVSRGSRISFSGYYTPSYYLRQLRDDDIVFGPGVNTYRRAEFSLAIGAVRWRQKLGARSAVEAGYQYEHRGYNADFAERTSNTHQGEISLSRGRLGGRGSLSLHGGYRVSDARGVDGDEVAGTPPDDADVGYHGILAGADGVIDLEPHRRHGFTASLAYELSTRDYTSQVASDTYHLGRNDVAHAFQAGLRWSAPGGLAVRGFYRFEKNTADLGASAPATTDVGSYTENQIGMAVEWSKVIWRRSGTEQSPGDDETP